MATGDTAEGLVDPAAFTRALTMTLAPVGRGTSPAGRCAVLAIRLDQLDSLARDLGVAAAEELYRLAGERLLGAARIEDCVAQDHRQGFFILMPGLSEPEVAASLAEKLLRVLVRPFRWLGRSFPLSASIGIALSHGDECSAARLLERAEVARRWVLHDRLHGYQFFDVGLAGMHAFQSDTDISPRQALEHGQYRLCYQPRVRACDNKLAGAEVLLRWHHPQQGLILPGDFIAVAEATGLIHDLGLWVVRETCRQWRRWHDEGLSPPNLSINVSPRQLERADFVSQVTAIVAQEACPATALELEITEQALMRHAGLAIDSLNRLKDAGFRVALDDFGTGHSSLACLRRLPLDTLKLDRQFVAELEQCPVDRVIIRQLVDLAHALGLRVVAEGVESEHQALCVREQGCDELQGYYIARPLTAQCLGERFLTPATSTDTHVRRQHR